MDNAAQVARDLPPADSALASAIAGETLRRLPDLDALIDGATRQRLPDDSKARTVLRLALAQKIGLGTPDHAVVATALPLVDGGPRRLVHGVLGRLLRKGLPPLDAPRLPRQVEERWRAAWGEEVVLAARERKLCENADLVFTTAPALFERKRAYNPANTHYVHNVGDADHFKKALDSHTEVPADLGALPKPVILFIGAVSNYKLNIDWLLRLARDRPNYQLALIGPIGVSDPSTNVSALRAMSSVNEAPRRVRYASTS